jgi:hypothetical protein
VVVVPHDVVVTTLVASGALAELERRYALVYLSSPSVTLALPAPNQALAPQSLNSRRGRALDFHFWNLSLFAYFQRHGLPDSASLKAASLPPGHRRLYRALSRPLPSRLLSLLDRRVFFARDKAITRFLREQAPALVIAPASAMDTYSHLVLRSAASLGIPTVMLVSHWDYFSKKGLLRLEPTRIYVWGEDMRRLAVERNGVDAERLAVVGAPHFEKYLKPLGQRAGAARRRLGIEAGARVVLFPGAATPFDEAAALRVLDRVAGEAGPGKVCILYRPHPRAWARRSAENIDIGSLARVRIDDPAQPGGTSDEHYLDLMSVADAVVSPFSTMTLEAALCGKPSLCTGFSDEVNSWDFAEAGNSDHIRILEGRRWLTICAERSRLGPDFRVFLAGLGDPGLAVRIRNEVRSTVFYNERSYAERLLERVQADFGATLDNRVEAGR